MAVLVTEDASCFPRFFSASPHALASFAVRFARHLSLRFLLPEHAFASLRDSHALQLFRLAKGDHNRFAFCATRAPRLK